MNLSPLLSISLPGAGVDGSDGGDDDDDDDDEYSPSNTAALMRIQGIQLKRIQVQLKDAVFRHPHSIRYYCRMGIGTGNGSGVGVRLGVTRRRATAVTGTSTVTAGNFIPGAGSFEMNNIGMDMDMDRDMGMDIDRDIGMNVGLNSPAIDMGILYSYNKKEDADEQFKRIVRACLQQQYQITITFAIAITTRMHPRILSYIHI